MEKKYFFDSSCIADWILIDTALLEKKPEERKKFLLEDIKKPNPKRFYSYLVLETINKNNRIPDFSFVISDLVLAEVLSVVHDKYRVDDMYLRGIPLKYWYKEKDTIDLPSYILKLIPVRIQDFKDLFCNNGKINICNNSLISDTSDFITRNRCDTHDAHLLSQCISSNGEYFVTCDGRLIDKYKTKKRNKLVVVTPNVLFDTFCGINEINVVKN